MWIKTLHCCRLNTALLNIQAISSLNPKHSHEEERPANHRDMHLVALGKYLTCPQTLCSGTKQSSNDMLVSISLGAGHTCKAPDSGLLLVLLA